MKYTFMMKKNIFMYNHLLVVSDGENSYEAIVESAPLRENAIVIWLEDFEISSEEMENIKLEMTKWFANQGIECIFNKGKGR